MLLLLLILVSALTGCMMPDHEATVAANEIKLAKEGIIRPEIGAAAPEITTQDAAGEPFSLQALLAEDKHVVLFFYPANNTPNTAKHLLALAKAAPALALENVVVCAVNPGAREEGVAFLAKYSVKLPLLDDPARATAIAYGCALEPAGVPQRTLVGISPEGQIVMFYRGFFPGADPSAAILKQLGLTAAKPNGTAAPASGQPAAAAAPPAGTEPPAAAAPPASTAPGSGAGGQ